MWAHEQRTALLTGEGCSFVSRAVLLHQGLQLLQQVKGRMEGRQQVGSGRRQNGRPPSGCCAGGGAGQGAPQLSRLPAPLRLHLCPGTIMTLQSWPLAELHGGSRQIACQHVATCVRTHCTGYQSTVLTALFTASPLGSACAKMAYSRGAALTSSVLGAATFRDMLTD